jgi:hypothetical protein
MGICVSNAFPAPIIVIIINMAFSCQVRNFLKKKHQRLIPGTKVAHDPEPRSFGHGHTIINMAFSCPVHNFLKNKHQRLILGTKVAHDPDPRSFDQCQGHIIINMTFSCQVHNFLKKRHRLILGSKVAHHLMVCHDPDQR